MMGFGLLMILSLLLMWRRAHTRGGFGRKASAMLRSVYLLVLGLGGWFTENRLLPVSAERPALGESRV